MSDAAAMDRGGNNRNTPGDDSRYPDLGVGDISNIDDEPIGVTAGAARHQGSRLPKMTKCELPSIDKLTGEETDSSDWVMLVENSLQPMMLGDLIDAQMPRPDEENPLYRRWNFWSSSVAAWMYLQVDKDVRTRLSGLANRPKYADQLFEELVSYAQGGDRSDNVLIDAFKLHDMKRDHYGSAEEFIGDYQRQINILRRSKIAPPPFVSIGIMIRELQDELPDMVFMREALRKVKEPHEITHEDFDKQCKELTIKARQLKVEANKAHTARRNPFRTDKRDTIDPLSQNDYADRGGRGRGRGRGGGYNRGGQRGRGRGGGRGNGSSHEEHSDRGSSYASNPTGIASARNAPPKGKDIYRYAKECREAEKQRIDGFCSFCGFGPHTAKQCFYLAENPDCEWDLPTSCWSLSVALREQKDSKGRALLAIEMPTVENQTITVIDAATSFSAEKAGDDGWLLDSGATKSITGNINDFVEYHQWEVGQTEYSYSDVHGKLTKSSGWGMLLIRAELPDGRINEALVKGYLDTSIPIGNRLLSTEHLAEHYGMH
jgi:uncharacterized membrane protein YgcG